SPRDIAAGPEGSLWFPDSGTIAAIGRISTTGQITEFSAGLKPGSVPVGIAAGPDGNLWFADGARAIGRIGSGIPDPAPSPSIGKPERNRSCKRKHRKALEARRARHALTPAVKRQLRKRLRKCLRGAGQMPV
ncbi:MAG TPA: hypothetical protein VGE91_04915, partial [Solirubrobacterales bacterium]